MTLKLSDGSYYPHIPITCQCSKINCNDICWHGNYKRGHFPVRKGKSSWNKGLHWNEKIKKKLSISNTKAWLDPEIRKKTIEGIIISSAKPEVKEKRSKAMKEVWSDVGRRKRLSEKQKIIKNLLEAKQKTSERMKIIANDPKIIAKIKATRKANCVRKIYTLDQALLCSELWSLENGITLCEKMS